MGIKSLQATTSVNKFGLAGGITFADLTTTTTARIGSGPAASHAKY